MGPCNFKWGGQGRSQKKVILRSTEWLSLLASGNMLRREGVRVKAMRRGCLRTKKWGPQSCWRGVSLLGEPCNGWSGCHGPSRFGERHGKDLGEESTDGISFVQNRGAGGICGRCRFPAPES